MGTLKDLGVSQKKGFPQQPLVFLLEMIIILGCEMGGNPPFKETPIFHLGPIFPKSKKQQNFPPGPPPLYICGLTILTASLANLKMAAFIRALFQGVKGRCSTSKKRSSAKILREMDDMRSS